MTADIYFAAQRVHLGADSHGGDYSVTVSRAPFNDAYRYIRGLLTGTLLLIVVILVQIHMAMTIV